jgi:hypothetical protein
MGMILSISPHGRLMAVETPSQDSRLDEAIVRRLARVFDRGQAQGLLHLATRELQTGVPPDFAFARDFACNYLTRLCHTPDISSALELTPVPAPDAEGLAAMASAAPPMRGLEYLSPDCLAEWWSELDNLVRQQMRDSRGSVQDYLRDLNPAWRMVGRVTFHLAENKRDLEYPFAFLATYAPCLLAQGRV